MKKTENITVKEVLVAYKIGKISLDEAALIMRLAS